MKGLEALNLLMEDVNACVNSGGIHYIDMRNYELVEKELKALEIIRRLPSDYVCDLLGVFRSFKDYTFGDFISWGGDETPILINEEEYNILKEVLTND